MNDFNFVYSVAYIRSIENKLLTQNEIENLVSLKSEKEILNVLADKGFDIMDDEIEQVLSKEYTKTLEDISKSISAKALFDILFLEHDFHNMKVILKAAKQNADYDSLLLYPTIIEQDVIKKAIREKNFSDLPEMFSETLKTAYDILFKTGDSGLSDAIIDKACLDFTMQKVIETKNNFLTGLFYLRNTLLNVKIAARCAVALKDVSYLEKCLLERTQLDNKALIKASLEGLSGICDFILKKGFKQGAQSLKSSINEFERYCENEVMRYCDRSKYMNFGIEPIISYVLKKQYEMKIIKAIFIMKKSGLSEEYIRQRVV